MSNQLKDNNQMQIQKPQENRIVIDDGSKVYNIYNQRNEKLGQFVFSPADTGIVERYDHAIKELDEIQSTIETGGDAGNVKIASDRMKSEFDRLFNADVSGSFFSIAHPFSILETGEFFAVNILNSVKAVIERETGIRLKRAKTRANKYTKKYHN